MNEPMNPVPPIEHRRVPDGHASHQPAAMALYLLFAHEPYYPLPAREINTSVVAAACLLHPDVKQPDGMRIHQHLVRGRRPGEIVPLATLTQELGGGAHWGEAGDWEAVVADLVRLIRNEGCDALSLGLQPIERALVCSGPDSTVRVVDPATLERISYGPQDRRAVLAQVRQHLAWAEAGGALWPGEHLLSPSGTKP
ncbi:MULTISPECIES: hypothetical protein [unclassified Streptomyces]|uniref:hypothetical protein n=1 Tax=unclassified Streptomyces TaxID=2593676 RepID=UPI002740B858|nr:MULTISPECIES: hypothetical protein [unclassified Streptomyces]